MLRIDMAKRSFFKVTFLDRKKSDTFIQYCTRDSIISQIIMNWNPIKSHKAPPNSDTKDLNGYKISSVFLGHSCLWEQNVN